MNKKISIILSTFNEEIAIKKTINKIRKHINDVEIIVVDDNSTDRTFEILKSLENDTTKVFLRKKKKTLRILFLFGSLVIFCRMAMGGHFFCYILFAVNLMIYLSILYYLIMIKLFKHKVII